MRLSITLAATLTLLPSFALAQELTVDQTILRARELYRAHSYAEAHRALTAPRASPAETNALRAWDRRLMQEVRSGDPALELELVPGHAWAPEPSSEAAPSVGESIRRARASYAAGDADAALRLLGEARLRHPDSTILARWNTRLLEELASPDPRPELELVRELRPPSQNSLSTHRADQEAPMASPSSADRPDYSGLYWTGALLIVGVGGIGALTALFVARPPISILSGSRSSGDAHTAELIAAVSGGFAGLGLALIVTGLLLDSSERSEVEMRAGPGDVGTSVAVRF